MSTYGRVRRLVALAPRSGYMGETETEVSMLFVVAVILLVIAVAGGILVHPLLFLIAIIALLAALRGRV